ncbi:methylthioadenosine nucleosidase (nucleoside phosphorylase) [Lapidilactobacillus concavus DSM 17758]|jgi:adenosylhomocysteine nucleosidase|uniref:adenosylhomocysteine nucleosidase n=1 Tax=Lapidilactobacillus concavus DSM 17758 TaxID=1423735 RepID=A0A0R1VX99_9LACO|nr:5'-methylthioadenosine/adenosylhomocysteine nucleosidase [Lapidilactobacillus concavus]KRM08507.1 methylthioadenosine nucleosidase (nucleoside phosphorylase) [Lapidilactobacillus concavus DSM 17758]GEL13038.1 5'-methylthioadenosine/S-adenosylhomocysteine nucleosidase [Lapidilactobacillus concavus]
MLKIGILVPMAEEIGLYQTKLSAVSIESIAQVEFTIGSYEGVELVLAQSGIGKVQAALTASLLFDHYQVDLVINSGSAAGVADGLSIGELVLSDRLVYHDVDVTGGGDYELGQVPGHDRYFYADQPVLKVVSAAATKLGIKTMSGLIATGDQFVADPNRVAAIKQEFAGVAAVEMEGAAVAQVAASFGKPFLIIRAISDNGDDSASVNFSEFVVQAGKNAATLLLTALPELQAIKGDD